MASHENSTAGSWVDQQSFGGNQEKNRIAGILSQMQHIPNNISITGLS